MPKIGASIARGEVYWAAFDPAVGAEIQKTRPVVVVSVNPLNKARKTIIGVPLSTSAPAIDTLNIALTGGSVARCDQIRTLDKSRLRAKIGKVSDADMRLLSLGLVKILGLEI